MEGLSLAAVFLLSGTIALAGAGGTLALLLRVINRHAMAHAVSDRNVG